MKKSLLILMFIYILPLSPIQAQVISQDDDYWKAKELLKRDKYEEAIPILDRCIKQNDKDAKLYNARGYAFLGLSNYHAALKDLKRAVEISPTDSVVPFNMSDVYIQLEKYDTAITLLNSIEGRYPCPWCLYSYRADCYYMKSDYHNALKDINKSIKLKPDEGYYYNQRGEIYFELDSMSLALNDYNRAYTLDNTDTSALVNKAAVLYVEGNYVGTINILEPILKTYPAETYMHNILGSAYYESGNYSKSVEHQLIFIKEDSSDAMTMFEIAFSYSQLEDYYAALPFYNKAIDLNPNLGAAYYNRATLYDLFGEYDKKERDFLKALELGYKPNIK